MNRQQSPYACHVFICTNDRHGARQSCADGGANPELKNRLKEQVEARGWKGKVRISTCGCMGLCAKGPNVMIYPQGLWFSGVTLDDTDQILETVSGFLSKT